MSLVLVLVLVWVVLAALMTAGWARWMCYQRESDERDKRSRSGG